MIPLTLNSFDSVAVHITDRAVRFAVKKISFIHSLCLVCCVVVRVSNPDMGVNMDPTDKVFFFADSGSPGGPN